MDDIVKHAMAKWPNVPHCYDWLALDARGNWRMRDEAAQRAGAPGDKLGNQALLGFINRNYQRDERGCWFFQNGPQRVFVMLEATPFIARTDPVQGFVLHTGQVLASVERVYMTEAGSVVLQTGDVVAQVDDRDVAQLLGQMELDGETVSDEALVDWLETGSGAMALRHHDQLMAVKHIDSGALPEQFAYVKHPRP
jgi:hypothetical protein